MYDSNSSHIIFFLVGGCIRYCQMCKRFDLAEGLICLYIKNIACLVCVVAYCLLLFVNIGIALASLITRSVSQSGSTFGLSILYFVLFTPCSFVCWYRPAYKAFRFVCNVIVLQIVHSLIYVII